MKNGGRHINYGVREFGMAAIMNGVALHGGFIPYGGTFLTFSDYSRNAIRMAALMKQRVIHVFTHDSIGLGEDGPTHQSGGARRQPAHHPPTWTSGARRHRRNAWSPGRGARPTAEQPTALLLSRQNLPYRPSATWATSRAAPTCWPSRRGWAEEESPGRDHDRHRL